MYDANHAAAQLITDSLQTIVQALYYIELDDGQTSADLDRLMPYLASTASLPEVYREADVEATPGNVARVLLAHLNGWTTGGQLLLDIRDCLPPMAGDREQARLVELIHACAWEFARIDTRDLGDDSGSNSGDDPDALQKVVALRVSGYQRFVDLARHLETMYGPESALPVWNTAANFATGDAERMLVAADETVRIAAVLSADPWIAFGLARRAHALTSLAQSAPLHRLAAFDATTAAIRSAATLLPRHREAVQQILGVCVVQDFLVSLQPLFLAEFGEPVSGPATAARRFKCPVWNIDTADLRQAFETLAPFATEFENARAVVEAESELSVERLPDRSVVRTSWTTFSFDHPSYRRSVPHRRSLSVSEDFGESMLELKHEITHIITMMSHLGMVAFALRAAATELELDLWRFVPRVPQGGAAATNWLAPLETSDVAALAQAERCLEVVRKLQILQATWGPWLEGVAVFGELAADPSESAVVATIEYLMINLEDSGHLVALADDDVEARKAAVMEHMRKVDERYDAFQNELGPLRLHTYLQSSRAAYRAGYLAVRNVVSAWRDARGGSLSAMEAFIILLHLTRFSTDDAVPRLDLPVDDFAAAAEDGILAWVDQAARVSAEDLALLLSPTSTSLGWGDGKVHVGERGGEAAAERHQQRVIEAMHSLVGAERSPLYRVPDADDTCRRVMEAEAEALGRRPQESRVAEDLWRTYNHRMSILPIGTTTAPFWLNEQGRYLICPFRTTERRADTGKSSYNLLAIPLSDEEFSLLRAEVTARPGRRMTVTRVADISPDRPDSPGRGLGRNLLVFHYGNWLTAQPVGFLTGSEEVDPKLLESIRDRLLPPPVSVAEERIAEGAGAVRTARWIASIDNWTTAGQDRPVDAWARRVRGLARDIEQGGSTFEVAASRALLRRQFPEEIAEQLMDQGLQALADEAPDVTRLAEALHRTAKRREPDNWLSSLASSSPIHAMFRLDETGWDVTADTATNQR